MFTDTLYSDRATFQRTVNQNFSLLVYKTGGDKPRTSDKYKCSKGLFNKALTQKSEHKRLSKILKTKHSFHST